MKHAYMRETHCLMCVSVKSRLRWALRFLVRCVYATVLLIYHRYIDAMHLAHGRPEKTLSTGTRSHACMHTS